MRITNLNPDHNIGASSWWVDVDQHHLLLDAGMHPKHEGRRGLPLYSKIKGQLDAIVVSHCHHDHVGSLPVALQKFPHAHVLMTELSYFLIERILHNSVNVMQRQRDELGIREYPLYTHEQVDDYAPVFQGFKYGREIEWATHQQGKPLRMPTVEFVDAGHTLGSAGVLVRSGKQSLFFTGDVCFHDQTLAKAGDFSRVKADVLLMESTRGNRATPPGFTREKEIDRLVAAITATLKRKGSVMIPAFALGRTQEILALLALLMKNGRLPRQPVFIGGLGRVFTEIYDLEAHRMNRQHPDLKLTAALDIQVLSPKMIDGAKLSPGRIHVLTSGMMNENTAAHELAVRMLGDARHGIFFVGYADPETPAGRLRAAKHGEKFVFSPGAGRITKKCQVEEFDLTAHAQREDLLEMVGQINPKVVILGHGDHDARAWFAEEIAKAHPRMKIHQPGPAETVEA